MPPVRPNIYKEAIQQFGIVAQVIMTFEEMSELQKVLCKFLRNNSRITPDLLNKVVDEIANVKIMVRQMEELFSCKEQVEERIEFKLKRLANRLGLNKTRRRKF